MDCNQNYMGAMLEEIALEGLDGITLDGLWLRLMDRPKFPFKNIDESLKIHLWKFIRKMANVQFFELPAEREPLFVFRRFDYVDSTGNFYDPEDAQKSIYPHKPVVNQKVKGSCSTFETRVDITQCVRTLDFLEVSEKYGNKMVVVADQNERKRALAVPELNPLTELTDLQYCVLERIGRARYSGEITQGKYGLQLITEDSKMLFYYRKFLCKHKLVTKQVFHVKVGKNTTSGTLLHLTKFSTKIKLKAKSEVESIVEYLKNQPKHFSLYKDVVELFEQKVNLKKILQKHSKLIKAELVPYRSIYPDAESYEWKTKNGTNEKSVRIIKLLESTESFDDDEEDDDDDENGLLDSKFRRLDRSMIRQCYAFVEQAGPRGLTQVSLGSLLAAPSLQARCLCKYLVKRNICGTAMIDLGRQRINHFYSKKFDSSKFTMKNEMLAEKTKLIEMVTPQEDEVEDMTNEVDEGPSPKATPARKKLKVVEEKGPEFFKNVLKDPPRSLRPTKEELDAIETEIITSKSTPTSNKNFPSLTGDPSTSNPNSLTVRVIKRASLILQAINNHKVIHDAQKLQRMINEEETLEGSTHTVDRKTVQRLIQKLVNDGHVKTIKVILRGFGKEKKMTYICHPSVDETHSEIQSAIEQAKMKLPIITKESIKRNESDLSKTLKYDSKAGRRYGYKQKFVRMKILHIYLHYLVYGYDGSLIEDLDTLKSIAAEEGEDDSFVEEMGLVYSKNVGWKMFISPLPKHEDYGNGWCLMSDILVRLPLALFIAIVNVPYEIPKLYDYLDHPIKKYFLVKNLPKDISNHLTIHRKYIFAISDIIARLGYIGLIQMGPQKLKEKDQVFIYLNKHAVLYDTTPSEVGYNHISDLVKYERIKYDLNTSEDVDQYWYDLWNFAMHTNLGCRASMTGQPVVVESVTTKKILMDALLPKTQEEAIAADVGYLPGDHLGAAGLDSDMFSHIKRNWYWTTNEGKVDINVGRNVLDPPSMKATQRRSFGQPESLKKKSQREKKTPNNQDPLEILEEAETVSKVVKKAPKKKDKSKLKNRPIVKAKHRKITRIVQPKMTRYARKPYYDQVDKEALRRMVKLRVDWSSKEDNLLLICKVASLYMTDNKKRHIAKNFAVIREILHSTYPELSKNKTSRACQRRMLYMMKTPATSHSVYMCLEEIRQDPDIHEKFSSSVENLDALLKSKGEGPKGCQEEYDKIFRSLVSMLIVKLKTITAKDNTTLDNISIPDTLDEFKNLYKIVVPEKLYLRNGSFNVVQNTVDVLCSVVNTVIHSSLCCLTDKTSYSYQLFFIYQQYPDKLLRSVMAKCRSMAIVSCRKRYKRWKTMTSSFLPLSSSPFQLSIMYVNILQTKYQFRIFSEAYEGLENILQSAEEDKDLISDVEIHARNGGECANIVELYTAGFVDLKVIFPEHLIVLDPRLSEQEESYHLIMKRFKEMLTIISSKGSKKEKISGQSDDEDDDEEEDCGPKVPDVDDTEEFNLTNKIGLTNTTSRLALYMMRDEPVEQLDKGLQHAHDYFVLKPCKVLISLDQGKTLNTLQNSIDKATFSKELKRLANFPEKHVETDAIIQELKSSCDKLSLVLLLQHLEQKKELGATYNDIEQGVGGTKKVSDILELLVDRQFILKTGSVNIRFVHNKFTKPWLVKSYFIPRHKREQMGNPTVNSSLQVVMDDEGPQRKKRKVENEESTSEIIDLCDESVQKDEVMSMMHEGKIFPKTIVSQKKRRWVNLPKENKFQDTDFSSMEPILISIKPWIRVDGTVNHRVLDRLLGSVLGHCLNYPGVTFKSISERFTPALQPVHVFELVQILVEIDCVSVLRIKKSHKATLFSKRSSIDIEESNGFGDLIDLLIEPKNLAISKLGHFIGKTAYKTDYLDALTYAKMFRNA